MMPFLELLGGAAAIYQYGAGHVMISAGGAQARINGDLLVLGIRFLRDRDSIQVGGQAPMFYSTETPAVVVTYAEPQPAVCARCKTNVEKGAAAVRCPKCAAWHHQPCWGYAPTCAACEQPTTLGSGEYQWMPEET